MNSLVISCPKTGFTNISDTFIDDFLGELNEVQVKIYLYLLRSVQGNLDISLTSIEDKFNYSEKDVIRAFKYLEKRRLIKLNTDENKNLKGLSMLDVEKSGLKVAACEDVKKPQVLKTVDFPKKKSYSIKELEKFRNRPEINELLYVSEMYLGRILTQMDIESIFYIINDLNFSSELTEYLIEYCANNDNKKMPYIEELAGIWAKAGISSIDEAKEYVSKLPKETGAVFKAFGIEKRKPLDTELSYIRKWVNEYGFSSDILAAACERTIMNIQKPAFQYADTILKNWKKENIRSLEDIERLEKERSKKLENTAKKVKKPGKKSSSSSKSGIDYDLIAQELLN
ncbi:MAG: DnaD domain protein [Lachnospiraceae bacterium]|nr:DnaD domain protein [Lachnospiraceae bacterium]